MPGDPAVIQFQTTLYEHPGVRDAVVYQLSQEDGRDIIAFVLAEEHYIEHLLGPKQAEAQRVAKWRKIYDLSQLTEATVSYPFAFNIGGWNSSYTRLPFPVADMREWIQTTVDRISTLLPKEVLEIGCGTGLLLLRLAPTCKHYVAVDFAPSVLMRLRVQLEQTKFSKKVELLERCADDFKGFAENSFDTVIINSVAQHFPSQRYLNRVIENSIRVVRPGGHVFVGDQRSLPLQEAYELSVEAFQAASDVSVAELRNRFRKRIQQEQQLILSPSYFLSLQHRFPKLSSVEIQPRRGSLDNEMNRFRYDAILRVGSASPPVEISFLEPPAEGWKVNTLRSLLTTEKHARLGVARIRNSRTEKDVRLLSLLASALPHQVVNDVQKDLDPSEAHGIHPEEIVRIAVDAGYETTLSWASCHRDGSYDAAFVRRDSLRENSFPFIEWPRPAPAAFVCLANTPGESEAREKLREELVSHCQSKIRGELTKTNIHVVDSFPRNADDSVNVSALLSATQHSYRLNS
jgi:ubiquinone/menaquinone biosynthesis C-methylase UbiE